MQPVAAESDAAVLLQGLDIADPLHDRTMAEQGRTAVSLLLRQIENRRLEPLRMELATRLILRDSTAPLA